MREEKPYVTGSRHPLPFSSLSPADFERLCLWLVRREGYERVEHVGAAGSDGGRDVIGYRRGARVVFQAKRERHFGPQKAADAVSRILDLPGDQRPDELVLVVACRISAEARERARHCAGKLKVELWGVTELDERVKRYPDLVAEFFDLSASFIGSGWTGSVRRCFQLGADLLDFTGYEREVSELLSVLEESTGPGHAPLCGIFGMGGVGKTSLALHLAQLLVDRFPEAQLWLDLAGTTDTPLRPSHAMALVIQSLHPGEKIPEDPTLLRALYRSVLSGRQAVLILDDAKDAAHLGDLLPPAPVVTIVTSRTHIAIDGIQPTVLLGFDEFSASRFLSSLVRRRDLPAESVSTLCALCGNLPLALRIAGSTLNIYTDLTTEGYIQALREEEARLSHLALQGRSVEAILALSARLLVAERPDLAVLWQVLSVFPAGFDLSRAELIVAPRSAHLHVVARLGHSLPPSVSKREQLTRIQPKLAALQERSLVFYEPGEAKYRYHDLLRLVARKVFEYGGSAGHRRRQGARLERASRRHAEFFLFFLRSSREFLGIPVFSDSQAADTVRAYWQDLEAAHRWAAERSVQNAEAARLCSHLTIAGARTLDSLLPPRERIAWIEPGLRAAELRKDEQEQAHHLNNLGNQYRLLGDYSRARGFYEKAVELSGKGEDRNLEAITLGNLGLALFDLGRSREAIPLFARRLEISLEIGAEDGASQSLGYLGSERLDNGDVAGAHRLFQQQLDRAQKAGSSRLVAEAEINLAASTSRLLGHREAAEAFAMGAVLKARELGDEVLETRALLAAGGIAVAGERTDTGVPLLEKALETARKRGLRSMEARSAIALGVAWGLRSIAAEDESSARQAAERSLQFLEDGVAVGRSFPRIDLAQAYSAFARLAEARRQTGDLDLALRAAEGGLDLACTAGSQDDLVMSVRVFLIDLYQDLSDRALASGDLARAYELCQRNLANARGRGDQIYIGTALFDLGQVCLALERWKEAVEHFRDQVEIAAATGKEDWKSEGFLMMGTASEQMGKMGQAFDCYSESFRLAVACGHPDLLAKSQSSLKRILPILAIGHLQMGDGEQAAHYFELLLPLCEITGDQHQTAAAIDALGELYSELNMPEKAIPYLEKQIAESREHASKGRLCSGLVHLGRNLSKLQRYDQAAAVYQEALPLLRESGDAVVENTCLLFLGIALNNQGYHQEAIETFRAQIELSQRLGDRKRESSGLSKQGICHFLLGEMEEAGLCLQAGCELAKAHGASDIECICLGYLARIDARNGQRFTALAKATQALPQLREVWPSFAANLEEEMQRWRAEDAVG